jgi:hypothetical protein
MIKLIKNKKTKKYCNAYRLDCYYKGKLAKIGNYDQKNNFLKLNLEKYITVLGAGEKPSERVSRLINKVMHFNNKSKKVKIQFNDYAKK